MSANGVILITLILCLGATTIFGVFLREDYNNVVQLVSDVQDYFNAASVFVVYAGDDESLNTTSLMHSLLREFSRKFVYSLTLNYSDVIEYSHIYRRLITRPLIIVLITSSQELYRFQQLSAKYDISFSAWFVIFSVDTVNSCNNPSGNSFNLAFDTELLVKCYNDDTIREWYSLHDNETKIYPLATWNMKNRLKLLTNKSLHERRNNLEGKHLSAVTIWIKPIPLANDNDFQDFFSAVLQELGKSLNFTLNFNFTEKCSGWYDAGNWTGAIGRLARGEVEFGGSEFTMTEKRLNVIEFGFPIMMSRSKLCVQQPSGSAMNLYSYFKVYHVNVWLAIKFTYIAASLVVTILERDIKGKSVPHGHVSENFLSVWGIFWQQGLPELPKETSVRIAYFAIFIEAGIIITVYSACLISYLAVTRPSLPFNDLEGLINDGSYKVITLREGADYEFFQTSTDSTMKKIRQLMPDSKYLPLTKAEGFEKVCNEKVAFYTYSHVKDLVNYKIPCDVVYLDTGRIDSLSITTKKRSNYKNLINYHLLKFKGGGLIHRMRAKVYRKVQNIDNKYHPMDIASVCFIYLVLFVGSICSFIIFCCEVFLHKANQVIKISKMKNKNSKI